MNTPTREWFGHHYPIIATVTDRYDLIAHPNGPALCDGDMLMSIDCHPDDPPEMLRLKGKASAAWREYAWPRLKSNFHPS